jgi:hypothetical protein
MAELKSNAKVVPASAPSLKSRGFRIKSKKMIPGQEEEADKKVSKKLEESFEGKDKPGKSE